MSSSPETTQVILPVAERPFAVRAHDGAVPVADLVRRADAATLRRVEQVRQEVLGSARAEMATEVEQIVRGCQAEVAALRESLLDNAIELGAVLAEAVIGRELERDLDLASVVRGCFERAGAETSSCRVRVHPDAVAGLERAGITQRVEVVADLDLARGEVRLDTPVGTLVHDPRAALAQARDALLAQLARPASEGDGLAEAA